MFSTTSNVSGDSTASTPIAISATPYQCRGRAVRWAKRPATTLPSASPRRTPRAPWKRRAPSRRTPASAHATTTVGTPAHMRRTRRTARPATGARHDHASRWATRAVRARPTRLASRRTLIATLPRTGAPRHVADPLGTLGRRGTIRSGSDVRVPRDVPVRADPPGVGHAVGGGPSVGAMDTGDPAVERRRPRHVDRPELCRRAGVRLAGRRAPARHRRGRRRLHVDVPEARGHRYRSVLVGRDRRQLAELADAGAVVVANSADSLSGWVSFLAAAERRGRRRPVARRGALVRCAPREPASPPRRTCRCGMHRRPQPLPHQTALPRARVGTARDRRRTAGAEPSGDRPGGDSERAHRLVARCAHVGGVGVGGGRCVRPRSASTASCRSTTRTTPPRSNSSTSEPIAGCRRRDRASNVGTFVPVIRVRIHHFGCTEMSARVRHE